MALSDVFQITHAMTLLGRDIFSVYHVLRANAGEVSADINDAFGNSILPTIRLLQNGAVSNIELRIFNLGDTTDFKTTTLSAAAGLRTGAASPPFVSGGIRFPSADRAVRSGYKRMAGMEEGDYAGGVLNAAALTLLSNVGDALVGNWLASADSHHVCNYIIVGRVCDETDPVTGECLKYRLPETDAELKFYQPTSHLEPPDVTSQVSRK